MGDEDHLLTFHESAVLFYGILTLAFLAGIRRAQS